MLLELVEVESTVLFLRKPSKSSRWLRNKDGQNGRNQQMDADLEELVKSFGGYGVESWMKASYTAMTQMAQELRDAIRAHKNEKGHDRECYNTTSKL